MMNTVVHFEMPYDNRAPMAKFYESVFGGKTQMRGEDMGNYVLATTTETAESGPKNARSDYWCFFSNKSDWPAQYPSVVIALDDIKESIRQ